MLSIGYFTCREKCLIRYFFASLNRQIAEMSDVPPMELIVIDFHGRKQFEELAKEYPHLPPVKVYEPKPTVWNGKHRKTSKNYFAASNSRNTFYIAAQGKMAVCVDDLSVLADGWLSNVCHAYHHDYIVYGAYKKVYDLRVDDEGRILNKREFPEGIDSRWKGGSHTGIVKCGYEWLFGCSFGLPMHIIEAVNGFDECCDGMGFEDCLMGLRFSHLNGCRHAYYNRNMLTYESEEDHHTNEVFLRVDKKVSDNNIYRKYGHDCSHVVLNKCREEKSVRAWGNNFDMTKARQTFAETGEFPPAADTDVHWLDGQPLKDM